MSVAVIGHVEWVRFASVPALPRAGQIEEAIHAFEEPGGGGGVAAVQLARLAGDVEFFTALGRDEEGLQAQRRLAELGVRTHVAWREQPTRQALTLLDSFGERAIVTFGARLEPSGEDDLPWERLRDVGGVYFTAGDGGALRAGRQARWLVATPRAHAALDAEVELDALVLSAHDEQEMRQARASGALDARAPRLLVLTEGDRGGHYRARGGSGGSWQPSPLPGPAVDSYGCGDSFAAGLTFALGRGDELDAALALAARCGAVCLTGHGPYEHQLRAGDLAGATEAQ